MGALLQVKDLGFSYNGSRQIFKDISFEVQQGEIVCLLGPNGIGKTTLLNCLARLREPLQGSVLNGEDMADMPARDAARIIGYVPQTLIPSFDYTVLEYVVGNAPWLGTLQNPVGALSACRRSTAANGHQPPGTKTLHAHQHRRTAASFDRARHCPEGAPDPDG